MVRQVGAIRPDTPRPFWQQRVSVARHQQYHAEAALLRPAWRPAAALMAAPPSGKARVRAIRVEAGLAVFLTARSVGLLSEGGAGAGRRLADLAGQARLRQRPALECTPRPATSAERLSAVSPRTAEID